ncbi:BZ3500_MvSof-1268-A1-R1_Chr7-1g09054 [Microbotryum saponariae]|uniref:BZ3500_MvSof-1268-A1-R1_Chr7-1g09054 protein n=1 Tax=Microbotryum saponariae TaxID=289078 RepID=A0A2X0LPT7_9BASI|nr:BZ3501_MvSof-1269-A2-R1_Chr7-1g08758 [Microbotryum saponariae]SDA02701.1 BZ3500_MvSof-1268-A1-R1_Chr7-1g09054 [Microbotryum saponariae]
MNQLQVQDEGGRSPIALQQQISPEPYLSEDESYLYEDEDASKLSAALVATPPTANEVLPDNIVSAPLLARKDKKIWTGIPASSLGERQTDELSNTTREAIFSNIILTTAEHNELRLRPLVPRKQKSEWKFRFYEWPSLLGPGLQKRSRKGWRARVQETTGPQENNALILVQAVDLSSALVYALGNHERRQPPPNVRRPTPFIRALARQEVFRQANTPTLAFESELTMSSLALPSFPSVIATRDIKHLPE